MTKLTPQQKSAQTRAKNKAAEEAKLKAESEAKTKAEEAKAKAEVETKAKAEAKAKAKAEAEVEAEAKAKEQKPDEKSTSTNETTKAQSQVVSAVSPVISFEIAGLIEVLEVSTKKPKKTFWRCGRQFNQKAYRLFVVDSLPMAIAENYDSQVFITEGEAQRLKAEPWLNVSVVELSDTPESDQSEQKE